MQAIFEILHAKVDFDFAIVHVIFESCTRLYKISLIIWLWIYHVAPIFSIFFSLQKKVPYDDYPGTLWLPRDVCPSVRRL